VIRGVAIGISLLIMHIACQGQFRSAERAAIKNIEKKRWQEAKEKLDYSLKKDSLNAASKFIYARYYFDAANPSFQLDSSYRFVTRALNDLHRAPEKDLERMKRAGLDSLTVVSLRIKIDSAAYQRAVGENTEQAFLYFLKNFPGAEDSSRAKLLRDVAAFLEAARLNTYKGFFEFLEKYPSAKQSAEARKRYEQLLYTSKTADSTLASYEDFLRSYPHTVFRSEVEEKIFEIVTASGNINDYTLFLKKYPQSTLARKARNILFHLQAESGEIDGIEFLSDSLKKINSLNHGFLVPILKGERFGFMNQAGEIIIPPISTSLHPPYKCGNITEDVLWIDHNLISRDGNIITQNVQEWSDLGFGFLKIQQQNCLHVLHKSGFSIGECIEDVNLVAEKFLALKKNNHWALYSLAGMELTHYAWDTITATENILVFKKGDQHRLASIDNFQKVSYRRTLTLSDPFSAVKPWPPNRLLVSAAGFEGVLNQQLDPVIPFDHYNLRQTFFGAVAKLSARFQLFDASGKPLGVFDDVIVHNPWIAVQADRTWRLMDNTNGTYSDFAYDSIRFEGPFVIGFNTDSLTIHFLPNITQRFSRSVSASFIPGKDSTAFLLVQQDRKRILYDSRGKKKFQVDGENVQYAGDGLFVISRKEKKGLVSSEGKIVLPVDFDAIGSVVSNVVSLLKDGKFGAYHINLHKLIKPQYDKNILVYNQKLLSTFQKGYFGFTDWDNKPLSRFEFEEIRYWNDTTALVKLNYNWSIYNINTKKHVEENIKSINYIIDSDEEKIATVKQENNFGVMSNRKDFIIAPTFSNVINIGSSEEPLYFTEKHVEEASIFVVIYYDQTGKMLYRQVYEEEAYQRIFCSDN
jgi:hypothetical protein